jgi:hypothetical protein
MNKKIIQIAVAPFVHGSYLQALFALTEDGCIFTKVIEPGISKERDWEEISTEGFTRFSMKS